MGAKFPNNDDMKVDTDMEIPTFFKGWAIFVGMLAMTGIAATFFAVYLLLVHFGVVA